MKSLEQQMRDMLDRAGVPDVKTYSSGDLVELANLLADKIAAERELAKLRRKVKK
jgi:hypothetical protein